MVKNRTCEASLVEGRRGDIRGDKENLQQEWFLERKVIIPQGDIKVMNIYASTNITLKYVQNNFEVNGVGGLNETPVSGQIKYRKNKQWQI